jgi:SAM-dependent methyltransferase
MMSLSSSQMVRAYEDGEEGGFWTSLAEAGLSLVERRAIGTLTKSGHGRVLAVGCGAGRESLALAKAGFATVGIDLSQMLLRRAISHSRDVPQLSYALANAVSLPLRDKSIDYVFMLAQVLGCVRGAKMRRSALKEAARVVRPEGTILVSLYRRSFRDYPLSYIVWLTLTLAGNRGSNRGPKSTGPSPRGRNNFNSHRLERLSEVAMTMLRARVLQLRVAARVLHRRIGGAGIIASEGRDVYAHPRLYRVSMTPRSGLAYHHLYTRKEWLADVRHAGLVVHNEYSIRELAMGRLFPSLLRDLDYLHYYVLRRA